MSGEKTRFCRSRVENEHFKLLHGYRDWLEIHDFYLCGATDV